MDNILFAETNVNYAIAWCVYRLYNSVSVKLVLGGAK
jgi:hypothetical protein